MKNLKTIAATVLAAVALTACSNEVIEDVTTSPSNAIGFKAVNSNADNSRATPITATNLTTHSFDVFAFTQAGTPYTNLGTDQWSHTGTEIKWINNKWDYVDPTKIAYWPAEPLNFYAAYPGETELMMSVYKTISGNEQKITATLVDEFAKTVNGKNYDIMYGIAMNQTKDTNAGTVKFDFKHTLSQVLFKAKTSNASLEVVVTDVALLGSYYSGVFTFPKNGEDVTYKNWDISTNSWAPHFEAIAEDFSPKTVKSATEAIWLSDETDAMMTIPAVLTAWDPATDGKATEATKSTEKEGKQKSALAIKCKIKQNGQYLAGFSADAYTTVYVPFGETLQPGKRYIYTLIFGGGYTDDGQPILVPITYDAEVSDWVDDTKNTNM